MATISRLVAKISADTSELVQGLAKASGATDQAAKDITDHIKGIRDAFAAYLSADLFLGFVKGSIDAAAQIGKLSQQTGIAVESLSALNYAASLNGASIQDLDGALKGLANKMMEAATGSGEAADIFRALRIEVQNGDKTLRSTEAVLMDMADAFAGMEDGAGKAALSQKLMEDAGVALIPVLNQGSDGIRRMRDEAKALGVILDAETSKRASEFNGNLTRLKATSTALGQTIANELIPHLNSLINEFLTGTKHANGFWDALRTFGTINPFRDLAGNLKATRAEIDSLTAARERYIKAGSDTSSIDTALATEKRRLEYLKDIERQQALIAAGAESGDAISRSMRTGERKAAPVITPSGGDAGKNGDAAKAAADVMKQAAEVDAFFADVENAARQRDIDNLNKFLENLAIRGDARMLEGQTELERANAQYEAEHARLLEALELEMITKQEFDALLIEAEAQKQATLTQLTADETAKRIDLGQKAADAEIQQRRAVGNEALGLLNVMGAKSKAAAVAAIALSKALSIAEAINNTAVAVTAALKYDPTGALAARVAAIGKVQIGIIAATGLLQAGNVTSGNSGGSIGIGSTGGSSIASGGMPVSGQQAPTINQTITIRGINEGELFSGESVRTLIDSLIDAQRNGARIVLA